MNNRIVCFVIHKNGIPNLPDTHEKFYKQSVVLTEQERFFFFNFASISF